MRAEQRVGKYTTRPLFGRAISEVSRDVYEQKQEVVRLREEVKTEKKSPKRFAKKMRAFSLSHGPIQLEQFAIGAGRQFQDQPIESSILVGGLALGVGQTAACQQCKISPAMI